MTAWCSPRHHETTAIKECESEEIYIVTTLWYVCVNKVFYNMTAHHLRECLHPLILIEVRYVWALLVCESLRIIQLPSSLLDTIECYANQNPLIALYLMLLNLTVYLLDHRVRVQVVGKATCK